MKLKNRVSFTMVPKNLENTGINLIKDVQDLCVENDKTLLRLILKCLVSIQVCKVVSFAQIDLQIQCNPKAKLCRSVCVCLKMSIKCKTLRISKIILGGSWRPDSIRYQDTVLSPGVCSGAWPRAG